MRMDFPTLRELKRLGNPGYVLSKAGLLQISEPSGGPYEVEASPKLRDLFVDPGACDIVQVLPILQDYVIAYAYDRSGLLSGSELNMRAVNGLRGQGIREQGLGQLRALIDEVVKEVVAALAESRRMYR